MKWLKMSARIINMVSTWKVQIPFGGITTNWNQAFFRDY